MITPRDILYTAIIREGWRENVAAGALAASLIANPGAANAATHHDLKASYYSVQSLKDEGTWATSGGRMANGAMFDENALTCATRLYSKGTELKVTNKANGKSVIVKVTDRIGKRFAHTRIDLSKAAFATIADLDTGVIDITAEKV
jgi:rare lipoprotein A (peptidoglycan hydrolase)